MSPAFWEFRVLGHFPLHGAPSSDLALTWGALSSYLFQSKIIKVELVSTSPGHKTNMGSKMLKNILIFKVSIELKIPFEKDY